MTPQQVCDYILGHYTHKKVPVQISKRLTTSLGVYTKQYKNGQALRKITLYDYHRKQDWSDYEQQKGDFNLSVIIHEVCHAIVDFQNKHEYGKCHSKYFFELSDKWHAHFGLKEIRTSKTIHGKVFRISQIAADKPVIKQENIIYITGNCPTD